MPHWIFFLARPTIRGGGGGIHGPSDLRNYWSEFQTQTAFESPGKHLGHPESDLGVTSDVTGLIEVKNIDISAE